MTWQSMDAPSSRRMPDWRTPFSGWDTDPDLSMVALVANHTLDLYAAALLWAAADHRASLIVAAGPQRAGKTTLLGAYRDLLPPDTQPVYLRGRQEPFDWVDKVDIKRAYVLVNELSSHTSFYLWGPAAKRLLALVAQGYRFGATLHADTAAEVLEYLTQSGLGVGLPELLGVHLVANIGVGWRGDDVVRRLTALTLITPHDGDSVNTVELALWDENEDEWERNEDPGVMRLVEQRLGMRAESLEVDLRNRQATLQGLLDRGVTTVEAVVKAIRGR